MCFHVGPTTITSSNMDTQEENGDYRQGSEYASVELSRNIERITADVAISGSEAATRPGITEPMYEEARRDPHQEWSATLVSLSNPMYNVTAMLQNEQSEYQAMQKEVKNILYGYRLVASIDSSS